MFLDFSHNIKKCTRNRKECVGFGSSKKVSVIYQKQQKYAFSGKVRISKYNQVEEVEEVKCVPFGPNKTHLQQVFPPLAHSHSVYFPLRNIQMRSKIF